MNKIVVFIPHSHKEKVKQAMFQMGAGQMGLYDCCSFEVEGTGQYRPLSGSNPHLGETDKLETVREFRVEMICSDDKIKQVVAAMKRRTLTKHPHLISLNWRNVIKAIFLLFFTSSIFANIWSEDAALDDYRQTLEKYFNGMDKKMEQIFKNMEKNRKGFSAPGLDSFFDKEFLTGLNSSCAWIDKGKKKVLPLDIGPVENSPLEVDVKNNQITIKGKMKKEEKTSWGKSLSVNSFHFSCPVPRDLDSNSIKVELSDNKYQIEMNKKISSKDTVKKQPEDNKTALPLKEGDVSI